MKLSILICSLPQRLAMFDALLANLTTQVCDEPVQIIYDDREGIPTGTKRNALLQMATGDYVAYIDDDDEVSDDYIQSILEALADEPDCVGIQGIMTTDGGNEQQWKISRMYEGWYCTNNVYYRYTNHLAPVKKEIALRAGFPDVYVREDYEYSMRLRALLRSESVIEHNIYHYRYKSRK
jgi:glycosyltransferase involved in cell wall biosynthesis